MQPKKSLGQNFLTSVGAINKIVETALSGGGRTSDIILEVGPGRGALTEALLKKFEKIVAVEKDHELIAPLKEKFASEISSGQLKIVEGDILELTPTTLDLEDYAIIANIPYYITGQFLRNWLGAEKKPKYMVLMTQKEVARRIVASDGKESILSISVKIYGKPEYIETVKRGSFYPAPNVDSAILKIKTHLGAELPSKLAEENFFAVLRAGFAHKRKLLASNLANLQDFGDPTSKMGICHINPRARAEDLSVEDWRCLAR